MQSQDPNLTQPLPTHPEHETTTARNIPVPASQTEQARHEDRRSEINADPEVEGEDLDPEEDDPVYDNGDDDDDDDDDPTTKEMKAAMGFAAFGTAPPSGPPAKKRKYDRLDAVVGASVSSGANSTPVAAHHRGAASKAAAAPSQAQAQLPSIARSSEPEGPPGVPRTADAGSAAVSYFKPSFIEDPWAPLFAARAKRAGAGTGAVGNLDDRR